MKKEYKLLGLGDSYTCGESIDKDEIYIEQLVRALRKAGAKVTKTDILARTGWTTSDLLHAINQADLDRAYDFVFLLIGVNNEYQHLSEKKYQEEFSLLLKKAIQFARNDIQRIFVLSIPDYGYTPFGKSGQQQISERIDVFNKINKEESQKVCTNYIDITDISRQGLIDPSLIAIDKLHPSGKMYELWVQRLLPEVLSCIK